MEPETLLGQTPICKDKHKFNTSFGERMELDRKIILCKEDPFFISPQGEGKYMGRLSTWLRTSTCNLRCSWVNPNGEVTFCDTAYTSHKPERNMISVKEAFDRLMLDNAPHVVITGGEPTTQKPIVQLVNLLEDAGKRVTIETNGTNFIESKATLISMSPKLATSGLGNKWLSQKENINMDTDHFLYKLFGFGKSGRITDEEKEKITKMYQKNFELHERNRYNLENLKSYMDYYGPDRYQFKFVANTEEDIEEIISKYKEPLNIPNDNIYLMPQGISHEQLNSRAPWIIEKCKELGWHFSDRIHIRIYGNKTGV